MQMQEVHEEKKKERKGAGWALNAFPKGCMRQNTRQVCNMGPNTITPVLSPACFILKNKSALQNMNRLKGKGSIRTTEAEQEQREEEGEYIRASCMCVGEGLRALTIPLPRRVDALQRGSSYLHMPAPSPLCNRCDRCG
jgi:hypothetical protein